MRALISHASVPQGLMKVKSLMYVCMYETEFCLQMDSAVHI